jgi:hypothetical protein
MTEDTWLTAANPLHMLMHVRRTSPGLRTEAGRRKFRLFACACVRRLRGLLKDRRVRSVLETAERFADGEATGDELWAAWCKARDAYRRPYPQTLFTVLSRLGQAGKTWKAVLVWWWTTQPELDEARGNTPVEEKRQLAGVVRDIFGNPFRPAEVEPKWLTPTVVGLAQGIYEERAFDRLPVLADALEDAGCDAADVLDHCRTGTVHVRGCWVVDLLLGK